MTSNTKVILLTAIESVREKKKKKKKKKKKQKNKRRESKSKRTAISKGTKLRSASLDVASVETPEAWSEHKDVKSGYQWISGLKMLGKYSFSM